MLEKILSHILLHTGYPSTLAHQNQKLFRFFTLTTQRNPPRTTRTALTPLRGTRYRRRWNRSSESFSDLAQNLRDRPKIQKPTERRAIVEKNTAPEWEGSADKRGDKLLRCWQTHAKRVCGASLSILLRQSCLDDDRIGLSSERENCPSCSRIHTTWARVKESERNC